MVELTQVPMGPALPQEGVGFTVSCRVSAGATGRPHGVRLLPDWTLDAPHDLATERIGVALGGVLTCVEVADRWVPAVRGVLEHRHRSRLADLEQVGRDTWKSSDPGACSCALRTWDSAAEAAAHLRTVQHWAKVFGAPVAKVAEIVERAGGPEGEGRCPLRPHEGVAWLSDHRGLDQLWAAGVHPALVPGLCRPLTPHGGTLPTHLVLAQAYSGDRTGWLAQFAEFGTSVLTWAAGRHCARDVRNPTERRAWVVAGFPAFVIDGVFAGNEYGLSDVHAYAAAVGVDERQAARVLGAWQVSGTPPPVARLVELAGTDRILAAVPGRAAVERVVQQVRAGGAHVSAVDAALALVRAGSAPDAARLLLRELEEKNPVTKEIA